jgi:hypothetical protein
LVAFFSRIACFKSSSTRWARVTFADYGNERAAQGFKKIA